MLLEQCYTSMPSLGQIVSFMTLFNYLPTASYTLSEHASVTRELPQLTSRKFCKKKKINQDASALVNAPTGFLGQGIVIYFIAFEEFEKLQYRNRITFISLFNIGEQNVMSYRALSDNLFLLLFLIILTICDNTRNIW